MTRRQWHLFRSYSAFLFLLPGLLVSGRNYAAESPVTGGNHKSQSGSESISSRRGRLSLNGTWRFLPAVGTAELNPKTDWGTVQVPGSWVSSENGLNHEVIQGSGSVWQDFDGEKLHKAWYERNVSIPSEWAGRAILLDFQRISTEALVYVNGALLGQVRWPEGMVDITSAARPGTTVQIRVLVMATASESEGESFLQTSGRSRTKDDTPLKTRGITGDAALVSRPAGEYIGDVFVRPSTRKKELGLDIEIVGKPNANQTEIAARLLDETGKEERAFTTQANLAPAERQTISVAFPWPNPRLWDFEKPNLYTLQLTIKGAGLDDEITQTFGFREFWVEGRRFILNGTAIRLRPDTSRDIEAEKADGFNFTEVLPEDPDERGSADLDEAWFEKADRAGWLTSGRLANMSRYIVNKNNQVIWDSSRRAAWSQRVEAELRRYRNHPSIVLWGHTPDLFGNEQDQNPRVIGQIDKSKRLSPSSIYRAGLEGCEIIKRLDPTRPVYTYEGADIGDVFTVSHYLDFLPLQEREEWMNEWVKTGDMPYMGVEFGTPLFTTFLRGRAGYDHALATEPLITEYSAIYLGHQAYLDETAAYRENYVKRFSGGQNYQFNGEQDRALLLNLPAFQKVEALFNRNTWRSWRSIGVTGGMVPQGRHGWNGKEPTESGKALIANNGPALAWITGPYDAITAKTHSYHVDEAVEKQVALINDTRQTQKYRYSWRATLNGRSIATGGGQGEIPTAHTIFTPLRFATPYFSTGKAEGEIVLTAKIGENTHEDRFSFRVFARRPRRDHPPSLPVFDPSGKTGDILPVADYIPRAWKGERNVPLVIIGQNALSSGRPMPGNLEAYIRGGGRALIFAQKPDWIEQALGMRTAAYLSRRVFPVAEGHPVMRGLDANDLRDWRGNSSFLPAKPVYTGKTPLTGWHWGNRGVVSSVSIEKPHRSSWRPILENEFDLAYTPLMEMDYGKGRVLWCTLDLEDHAVNDAAAERVFVRILDYALHAPLTPKAARVVYVGGKLGAETLNNLGVVYQNSNTSKVDAGLLTGVNAPQLLIVGEEAIVDAGELGRYLQRGGKAFFLPRQAGREGTSFAPVLKMAVLHGSEDVPTWPECRGIGISDMHWRADVETPAIQSLPDVEANGERAVVQTGANGLVARMKLGKGVALFCQLDPDSLDADTKTYLRLTRWRQTHVLCQLLSNMGASFQQDARIFHPAQRSANSPGFYHPDYRADFPLGDNPYRYYRW